MTAVSTGCSLWNTQSQGRVQVLLQHGARAGAVASGA